MRTNCFLKPSEVGKILHVQTNTVRQFYHESKLKGFKTPTNQIRISKDSIIEFMLKNTNLDIEEVYKVIGIVKKPKRQNPNQRTQFVESDEKKLLKLNEASKVLHIQASTIRLFYHEGRLKGFKTPSNQIRIYKDSIIEFVLKDTNLDIKEVFRLIGMIERPKKENHNAKCNQKKQPIKSNERNFISKGCIRTQRNRKPNWDDDFYSTS